MPSGIVTLRHDFALALVVAWRHGNGMDNGAPIDLSNASAFQRDILATLKDLRSPHGLIHATPTDAFWTLWRESKSVIRAAGFTPYKNSDGSYDVQFYASEMTPEATLEQCQQWAKAKRAERAFWDDPRNWHLIPNSKTTA